MAMPPPSDSHPPARGALAAAIVSLAGTPDHSSTVGRLLLTIAVLTADLVAAVRYTSITALRGRTYTTVAVSDELIRAIDEIQYADSAGPCVEVVDTGVPVGVPDIAATVQWPRFHEAAPRLGLHASVSTDMIMTSLHCTADDAYLSLCIRAGAAGLDLADAAATVIAGEHL